MIQLALCCKYVDFPSSFYMTQCNEKQNIRHYREHSKNQIFVVHLQFLVGFVLFDLQFYMYVLSIVVCPFVLFLLAIVLSVLRYTVSDCPFGFFKLYLEVVAQLSHSLQSNLYIKATHGNLKMWFLSAVKIIWIIH